MKKIVILGGGGFIGGHLGKRLKNEGCHVRIADIKNHEYFDHEEICHEFIKCDLTNPQAVALVIPEECDELYQLAADMGGAGYIFTGENDANVMHNSALINLNVAHECVKKGVKKVFYSSSACMYPEHNQLDPTNPNCEESSAYPANPDSEYGWEKLFSERMCRHFTEDFGLDTRIARYHNIYGPLGTFDGGREKAPAALCRKIALAKIYKKNEIDVWGDGNQTRTFLYIEDCIEATLKLFNSNYTEPVNIGSDEQVSINQMIQIIQNYAGINDLNKNYQLDKPKGVRGRSSDNTLINKILNWNYHFTLEEGLKKTYDWIYNELRSNKSNIQKFRISKI